MTLKASVGSPFARILSVGAATPSRVIDNEYLLQYIDSSDEWITQRTGIRERRWIGEDEDIKTLSLTAGRQAIERAGVDVAEIDAVILSTISHYHQTPALAPQLATELGLTDAAAFDISAACAGYTYGVAMGESLIRTGAATYVLTIGVEALSWMLDMEDRSTAFLFSDGAGASVLGPSDVPAMGPVVWGSNPDQSEVITIDSWSDMAPGVNPKIQMDGKKVFRWATTYIANKSHEALSKAGLEPSDLDVFIPHQANNRITDSMLRHLKLPENVVVSRDIVNMGNSSAASVPLAMEALLESGEAKSGQTALIIGFGAGLVFAGQVVTLP